MVNLVTIPKVELMKVGSWQLKSGHEFNVTPELIAAAIDAHNAGVLRKPVIRIGHNDPRFTGDPACGYIDNVEASEDGSTLYGDLVGLPQWLGDIMASAYPDRSIEGLYDYTGPDGSAHPFVMTGLALLGATRPGVESLKSLQDVARLYDIAAAGQVGGTAVELPVEAAKDADKPYGNVDYADPGYQSDGKKRYPIDTAEHVRAAWSYVNQGSNAAKYSGEQLSKIKAKIRSAAKKFDIQIEAAAVAADKGKEAMVMASQREKLNQLLGLDESADDAAVDAALDDALKSREGAETEAAPKADDAAELKAEEPQPVAAAARLQADIVPLDRAAYTELVTAAAEGREARRQQIREADNALVEAAIGDGRIPPARRQYWLDYMAADRDGGQNVLASLQPGAAVPLVEAGYGRDGSGQETAAADPQLEAAFNKIIGMPIGKEA